MAAIFWSLSLIACKIKSQLPYQHKLKISYKTVRGVVVVRTDVATHIGKQRLVSVYTDVRLLRSHFLICLHTIDIFFHLENFTSVFLSEWTDVLITVFYIWKGLINIPVLTTLWLEMGESLCSAYSRSSSIIFTRIGKLSTILKLKFISFIFLMFLFWYEYVSKNHWNTPQKIILEYWFKTSLKYTLYKSGISCTNYSSSIACIFFSSLTPFYFDPTQDFYLTASWDCLQDSMLANFLGLLLFQGRPVLLRVSRRSLTILLANRCTKC